MKCTIRKMKHMLTFVDRETKKVVSLNGYSLMNEYGKCMIIVYGESRKDSLVKLLEDAKIQVNL